MDREYENCKSVEIFSAENLLAFMQRIIFQYELDNDVVRGSRFAISELDKKAQLFFSKNKSLHIYCYVDEITKTLAFYSYEFFNGSFHLYERRTNYAESLVRIKYVFLKIHIKEKDIKIHTFNNAKSLFGYIKETIDVYEDENEIHSNSKQFPYDEIEDEIIYFFQNNDEVKIYFNDVNARKTLCFYSDELFGGECYIYNKRETYSSPLARKPEELTKINTQTNRATFLSVEFPCSSCGTIVGSRKTYHGDDFCTICHKKKKDKKEEKEEKYIGVNGKVLTGVEKFRDMTYRKRQAEKEYKLKNGITFICASCKRTRTKRASNNEKICTFCAKIFAERGDENKLIEEQKALALLKKKRLGETVEDKSNRAENEKDLIAQFLAKKGSSSQSS